MKKTLLSGIQPSGRPHIGNFFGAMKQFVDLQNDYDCLFMIADYHALNTTQNRGDLAKNILNLAIDYLAIGLDPAKVTIFKQSDVSAHTELTWIFDAITPMPYLMRAHAFKDAEAKNKEISVGTFNYPMLMAADILLYDTDIVPVGQDQKQHIEYARDTAGKFNHIFGSTVFKLPEPLIQERVAVVPGIDGEKMSKSHNNTIPLFASKEDITKAVMSIVTDSSSDKPKHVYNIHRLFRSDDDLAKLYSENKGKYKILKQTLAEDIEAFVRPMRERREKIAADVKYIAKVLEEGAAKAHAKADTKLRQAKQAIGVL